MAQCPMCAAPVADDFGLIECDQCGAQLVVHMDGRVEHHGALVADIPEAQSDAKIESSDEPVEQEEAAEFLEPMREFEPEPDTASTKVTRSKVVEEPESGEAFDLADPDAVEDSFSSTSAPPPLPEPEHHDPMAVLDLPDESFSTESYSSPKAKPSAVDASELQDVANFANSSDSGGRDGTLRYTLFVEGIDTADVREAFKDAITDKKLLWDTENILRNIKRGEVKIENVSSAKAFVVVSRLKLLPLKVSWEQHAINEA